jgi:hypothetical protein
MSINRHSINTKILRLALLLVAARQANARNGYFLEGYGTDSKAEAGVGIDHSCITVGRSYGAICCS